jgi:ribonuclease-3
VSRTATERWARATLDHRFADATLLARALAHSGQARDAAFERLEFLGDRVLGLAIAAMLLERFPGEDEGALARRHAALALRAALAEVAEAVGLDTVATLPGATLPGRDPTAERGRAAVLADTFEAVLGALYLDGGWAPAAAAIERLWRPLVERAERPPEDAKTRLQEWAQARGLGLPCYRSTRTEGPDHAPWFRASVAVGAFGEAEATGTSKRAAETRAAEALLARLEPGP